MFGVVVVCWVVVGYVQVVFVVLCQFLIVDCQDFWVFFGKLGRGCWCGGVYDDFQFVFVCKFDCFVQLFKIKLAFFWFYYCLGEFFEVGKLKVQFCYFVQIVVLLCFGLVFWVIVGFYGYGMFKIIGLCWQQVVVKN